MKYRRYRLRAPAMIVIAVVSAVFVLAGCITEEGTEGRIKVAASIAPLADFCRNVGGELVEVEVMVPPGASPHTYEPTAEQMEFLSDASLFVYNGLDLENWITDIVDKVGNTELVEVEASGRVPHSELIEADGGDHDAESEDSDRSEEAVYDPHVWLDPNLAISEVEAIRDGLIEVDREKADTYRKNANVYIHELEELDRRVAEKTAELTRKKFVSFHPAFVYYADRYGLEQVAVIEELPGKEPSAKEIAEIIDAIKQQGVQVIFTEPQFDPRAAEAIAAESGVEVVLEDLDPLGVPGDNETGTYIKLIEHGTRIIAEAME
jgi:zinc transport system substrate-binding protein